MGSTRILLIDGYNVIHRVPKLRPSLAAGLENARMKLALQVANWGRAQQAYKFVIVFDFLAMKPGLELEVAQINGPPVQQVLGPFFLQHLRFRSRLEPSSWLALSPRC